MNFENTVPQDYNINIRENIAIAIVIPPRYTTRCNRNYIKFILTIIGLVVSCISALVFIIYIFIKLNK